VGFISLQKHFVQADEVCWFSIFKLLVFGLWPLLKQAPV
jgi:hypothetical protein